MAVTSGQVNTNTLYDSYFWVKWSQKGTQNIENNQTTINWSCGVYCGHNFYSNAIKMSAVTINGSKVYGGGTYSNFSKGNNTIASGTLTITHDSNGNKTFSVSAFTGWLYQNYNYSAAATSFELTQIPRISSPTLSVETIDFGKAVTIYTNRKSSSFTHKLWYKYGNTSWIEITPTASVAESYSWTVPTTLMNQIPNASSLDITISCDTYYNNAYIGELHAYLKATVPTTTDCYPKIQNIVWTKTSGEPSSWPMTQGVSTGTMQMSGVSGAYGSTIKSYSLTFAGLSSNNSSLSVGNLASAGTLKAIAKVTDSRGRPATKEVEFVVAEYAKPVLTVIAYRCDNTGAEDATGDSMFIKATANITAVGNNLLDTLMLYYKRMTDTAWGEYELSSGDENILSASSDSTWEWRVVAKDFASSVDVQGSIPTGEVIMDIKADGTGVSFGKVAEKSGLTSAWDLELPNIAATNKLKGTTVEGTTGTFTNLTVGGVSATWVKDSKDYIVEQGTSGIWTYRKWNSGIAECWGLKSVDNLEIATAWGYVFESATAISEQFPSGLFTAVPVFNMNVQYSSAGVLSLETVSNADKNMTCYIYPTRATPGTVSLTIAMRAAGRWK